MRGGTTACLLALLVCSRSGWGQPAAPRALAKPRTAVAHLANAAEVRRQLGLVPDYEKVQGLEALKVAVLDYGFAGLGDGRPYLPANTVVVEHYDPDFVRRNALGDPAYRKGFAPNNPHGRLMAQVLWAVTGSRPNGPRFYLLNANGPTMLRRAVRYAIAQGVDLILFCGSFEGGGNGDGWGPINRIVAEALAADILWINAAGNFGYRVYNGRVRPLPDGYLRLREGSDVAALRFRNHLDENDITLTLTWNDYRETEDAGTDKDLDLYVEDWAGRRVGASENVQISGHRATGPGESRNPRERIVLKDLPASPERASDADYTYRIRVRAKRGRFSTRDRLRILLTASRDVYLDPATGSVKHALEFLDASRQEELYPPADYPLVLTVGDTSSTSSVGPTLDRRVKPDVLLEDSRAFFTDGEVYAGSSTAAAYLAGIVTVLKAAEPGLRPRHLLQLARQGIPVEQATAPARATSGIAVPRVARPAAGGTAPGIEVSVTGPRGRVLTIQTPASRLPRAVGVAPPAAFPPPTSVPSRATAPGAGRSTVRPNLGLRFWKTPTPARLAQVVREM